MSSGFDPRRLWASHRRLVLAFGLALVVAGALLLRGLVLMPHQGDPRKPVAPWMTPRFVVHTYDLDGPEVARILNLPEGSRPRQTLAEIARAQGRPVAEITDALQAAVDARKDAAP